jgi:DNA-binding protein HU-beta
MPPAAKAASAAKKAAPAAKKAAPVAKKTTATAKKAAAPEKVSPAKAATLATVTMKQLAASLAEGHDLPSKQIEAVLSSLVALATRHLKRGDKLRLAGLGIL